MKIKPLYLLNVILTVVLLTSLVVNAAINGSGTAITAEYDAFFDANEDGKINILDLVIVAGYFGTSGNPTKNVNVTNWPALMDVMVTNFPTEMDVTITNWQTEPEPKTIVVCENYTITETEEIFASVNAEEIHLEGYSKIHVFATFVSTGEGKIWCLPECQNITMRPSFRLGDLYESHFEIWHTESNWDCGVMGIGEGAPIWNFIAAGSVVGTELTIILYCYN